LPKGKELEEEEMELLYCGHQHEEEMETLDCGHPESEHNEYTRGYAIDPSGRLFRYDCVEQRERCEIERGKTFVGYVDLDKRAITNWPERKLMDIVDHWHISNNMAGQLLHIIAKDHQGNRWYGNGVGDGYYIKLHKTKKS
jgi:hypothetical protein